ncbi:hypothetical protein POM88_021472 [Heracleum sosnowskyi]|uniref:Uncharacterized protein n=1 Tax=Heracleum sosnowskyi TaxID=360622 RepID=A0AAD8ID96_9APIA|nr:hypothetical protein POM88_021472 [Heracleum sosnowskyi]
MLMLILVIHVFVKDNKLRAYFNRFQVKLKRNVATFAAGFRANSKELQTQANGDGKPATGAKTTGTEVQNELVENKSQNKIENVDWEEVVSFDLEIEANLASEFPSFLKNMLWSHVAGGYWLGLPKKFTSCICQSKMKLLFWWTKMRLNMRLRLKAAPALAVTGILVYIGSFSIGMGSVPWVVMSEVF